MKYALWIIPLGILAAGAAWLVRQRNAPPEVRFAIATTAVIVDTLVTNGKVEPVEYALVRASRAGTLTRLAVHKGKTVATGQIVGELDNTAIYRQREAAEARVAQLEAELRAVAPGGRAVDRAEIDGQLRRLSLELRQTQAELDRVNRLIEKQAATPSEAQILRDRIATISAQQKTWEGRRGVLFTGDDRGALEARLSEARASLRHVIDEQDRGTIRSPLHGMVYQLDVKPGAYLNPGDLVATVGDVSKLAVKVYVDEPELARVAAGMTATITWDGQPGREWRGEVSQMPRQIVPLQSRQVGEVVVRIANEDAALPAGANINAAIRSREAANAVVIPKEALRRDTRGQGVFVVDGGLLRWRPVRLGVTNVTHAQVLDGVTSGERVVLATETSLSDGQFVNPRAAN